MRAIVKFRGQIVLLVLVVAFLLCTSLPSAAASYHVTVLTSDQAGAPFLDANLQNPWGLAYSATSPFWIADNNTGVSTIYNGTGAPYALVVTVPPTSGEPHGTPTGIVFNGTSDFVIGGSPALFIFATEDGTISGWNASLGTHAAIGHTSASGANYKGLELATDSTGNSFLFAANFSEGRIDVFDGNFAQTTLPGNFLDPNIPAGYAPFNIALINGHLFVTYAKQNAAKTDAIFCAGCGFVDSFDLSGNLIKRFASKGHLNAPWGMALAPGNFGTFSGDALIGNLGDGKINAYKSGKFLGQLLNSASTPIVIKKLWGLKFGNGGNGGLKKELFFTAGPGNYLHGRFGKITFH